MKRGRIETEMHKKGEEGEARELENGGESKEREKDIRYPWKSPIQRNYGKVKVRYHHSDTLLRYIRENMKYSDFRQHHDYGGLLRVNVRKIIKFFRFSVKNNIDI